MILGVDHVALGCHSISEGIQQLTSLGYTPEFVETALFNHEAKKPFLTAYNSIHDLALCKRRSNVAIELTNHSVPVLTQTSCFEVLFSNPSPTCFLDEAETSLSSWGGIEREGFIASGYWSHFDTQVWYQMCNTNLTSGIRAIRLRVTDIERSLKFWMEGLSGQMLERSTSGIPWARLRVGTLLANWTLELVIYESLQPSKVTPMLDGSGFPCLALLSNRISYDLSRALDAGGSGQSEEFDITVGGKILRLVLLRGPDSEVIELIQVPRKYHGEVA